MSTEIAENNVGTAMAIPSHLAAAFKDASFNNNAVSSAPQLSLKGKMWTVIIEGSKRVMMVKDEDGEESPRPTVKVIILNQVEQRSQTYFEGDYVEGSNAQPDCWSTKGISPDAEVSDPQATRCNSCPQSVKGSKVRDNGDLTTACRMNRRIAVVPSTKPDFPALLLKLPITSVWEKEPSEEAQGWFAYEAYIKNLKANGVPYPTMVETIMKFDSKGGAFPKVLFKQNGFIGDNQANIVVKRMESEEVLNVLGIGEGSGASNTKQITATASPESNVAPAQEASTVEEVEDGAAEAEAEKAAAQAAKEAKAAKAAKAKAEKEAKVAEEAANVVTVDDDEGLSDVMDDWD